MPACRYVEEIGAPAMLVAKRLAGVTPEVNLRECVICMPLPRMPILALKPKGDVTRSSKQGYQWPHKKQVYSPIFFKKPMKIRQKYNDTLEPCEKVHTWCRAKGGTWMGHDFKKNVCRGFCFTTSSHRTNFRQLHFGSLLGNIEAFPKWIQWQKYLSLQ